MQDLNSFIQAEKQKVQQMSTQTSQQPKGNVKMSLLDLKNAVESGTPLNNNPLVENIKKIDNTLDPVAVSSKSMRSPVVNGNVFEEKEDEFTKQLLMKTRDFISNKIPTQQPSVQQMYEGYNIHEINPKSQQVHTTSVPNTSNIQIPKDAAMDLLKDTMLELYVKEKVEGIIKDFLISDEGKLLVKSLVLNLFKKK